MWQQISICKLPTNVDRFHHAGLSISGQRCLVSDVDDDVYFVWDVKAQKIIWADEGATSEMPELEDWIEDGYVMIDEDVVEGQYRIFGFVHNYPVEHYLGIILEAVPATKNVNYGMLYLKDDVSSENIQALQFDDFSGDWAFASFSEDGSTIAVLTPYHITFFGNL